MYACNLFVAKGFVDEMYEDQKWKRYSITEKGRDVIGYYAGLQDLIQVSAK